MGEEWDDLVDPTRVALEALIAQGDKMSDRIEELEAENHLLKTSGIVEVAVRNPNVSEYIRHWEGRAETAEAKLAKAVRLIKLSVELGRWDLNPSLRDEMIDFTTELTGETNE